MTAPSEAPTRIVALTQVFPRQQTDPMGAFVLHLYEALGASAAVTVVAPHAPNLATRESFGTIQVRRFRYAPARWERLAYTGEMHRLVAQGLFNKFLFLLFNLAFLLEALVTVRAQRAQVIHAHWWLPAGLTGALVSVLLRLPLIVTTHGTDIEQLRRTSWAIPLARWIFARARAITCGSNYLREQLLELGVAEASRVRVIPMPVNPLFEKQATRERFVAVADTRQPASDDKPQVPPSILTVARLTRQKSIDTLIDALALLQTRGCNARLQIIGEGDQRAALEQRARELNLQDRVEFLGGLAQADLPRYYSQCAVFVLPSIREGIGLVLAEALLCGAPVIATNMGGVTDIVKDGETGLLVPERDAHALADALEKILRNPEFAAQLASNGQAWVREHFSSSRVSGEFLNLYHTVYTLAR